MYVCVYVFQKTIKIAKNEASIWGETSGRARKCSSQDSTLWVAFFCLLSSVHIES